jgi:hypothetical protein
MKHWYSFMVLALVLTGVSVGIAKYASHGGTNRSRSQFYAPSESAWTLQQVSHTEGASDEGLKTLHSRLSPVFDKRYGQYKSNLDGLYQNLWLQVIFLMAAAIAACKRLNPSAAESTPESFKVPVAGLDVPIRWAYLALPVCLVYLWLRFGFILNELIDARIVLWKITEALQAPVSAFGNPADPATIEAWRHALYTFSHNPAIYDGGFLDGWFVTFQPEYTLLGTKMPMASLLMFLFGIFFGCSNGAALGLLLHGYRRFGANDRSERCLFAAYFWGVVVLLGLAHIVFWQQGDHPNWQQPVCVVTSGLVALWFIRRPVYLTGDTTAAKPG